jgi:Tol biopolymer transport system component
MIAVFLIGCQIHRLDHETEKTLTAFGPGFTYSTSTGAIWKVNVKSYKTQLLSDDGIQKQNLSWSPNHQQLAYVTRELLETSTRETTSVTFTTTEGVEVTTPSEIPTYSVKETLIVADADGTNRRKLAGPARAIQYTWAGNSKIDLQLTHHLGDGNERQQWEQFQVDVETENMVPVEQTEWITPVPIIPSPNGRWSLSIEAGEGTKHAYLLDADGNRVATIYERPVDQDVISKWSPDSRYVLYLSYAFPGTDDIHIYDLITGRTHEATHFVEKGEYFVIGVPRWSPTGEWIFFVLDSETRTDQPCLVHMPDGGLQCFDISSKSDQYVWSRDGRYLAFLAPRGDAPIDIYAIDAVAEELLNLTQDGNDVIESWIAPW